MGKNSKFVFTVVAALVCLLVLTASSDAQTVLERTRLGNAILDIVFVPTGPFAGHIVIQDGCDVFGVPAEGRGNAKFRKLFDVLNSGVVGNCPFGMAYLEAERHFVFVDVDGMELFFTDHNGNPVGEPRPILQGCH